MSEGGLGSTVASHYNTLQETGIEARKESRIIFMRGFNNWAKSTLINDFVGKIRHKTNDKNNIQVWTWAQVKVVTRESGTKQTLPK
ncbi:RNMT [Bugula neritina]|uniref:RNMT n=1 Tax=Bugula neritina TaxID=10212 RepID=A0A7J7K949_BUGNE|nr:RNMT [Bugula neritina]